MQELYSPRTLSFPVPPWQSRPVVLIADDNSSLLELFQAILENDQYRVLTAVSGQIALDLAERWMPDALVTDVAMPCLDGFGLIRAVRRLYPDLPAIVMTGESHHRGRLVEEVAVEHGAVATLAKPFDVFLLEEALRTVVPYRGAAVAPRGEEGSNGLNRR